MLQINSRINFCKKYYYLNNQVSGIRVEEATIISIIKALNRRPQNKDNLDHMALLLEGLKLGSNYELNEYLSAVDSTLSNYRELIDQHMRTKSQNFDVDSEEDVTEIFISMELLMHYAEDYMKLNAVKDVSISGTPTAMFQTRFIPSGNNKFNTELNMPSPSYSIFVSNNDPLKINLNIYDLKESDYSMAIWSVGNIIFRKPEKGYFATNIVKIRAYKVQDGVAKEVIRDYSMKPNEYLSIMFPLLVTPPEKNLKKALVCIRFNFIGVNYKITERIDHSNL